jgi:hypothetical protein
MYRNEATADRIKTLLNGIGYATFGRDVLLNNGFSSLVNTLYYNTNKVVLKRHTAINSPTRVIDHYKLYYKAADLATNPDTAFLNILICHLKAGNTPADSTDRRYMADAVVNYLTSTKAKGPYIIQGDFNTYTSTEPAFTRLTTRNTYGPVRFFDPINALGYWNNNGAFARHHTQSTSISGNGCLSGGGLDDRFDMILANQYLLKDSNGVKIVPNSYVNVGNNGNLFNRGIDDASNTAWPRGLLTALANMSDHLPITIKIAVNRPVITALARSEKHSVASLFYNKDQQVLSLNFNNETNAKVMVSIVDLNGRQLTSAEATIEGNSISLHHIRLERGVYLVRIKNSNDTYQSKLLVW